MPEKPCSGRSFRKAGYYRFSGHCNDADIYCRSSSQVRKVSQVEPVEFYCNCFVLSSAYFNFTPAWLYSSLSLVIPVPEDTCVKVVASPVILPNTLTGLAGRGSAPSLTGVGPKYLIWILFPISRNLLSNGSGD